MPDPADPRLDLTAASVFAAAPPGSTTEVEPVLTLPGYEVMGVIGVGGCGVVYRANQLKLSRIVALKTISRNQSANAIARFEKEAELLARLQHPNVVSVFDSGRHAGQVYFAMELLDGRDLGQRLKDGPLDERTTWFIIRQAASALAQADQFGLIHRDIKPGNLFLVPAPAGVPLPPGVPLVKVTDFGLALMTQGKPDDLRLTQTGAVVGTPLYMAPEQFTDAELDRRADIYALGVTAFHAICGYPPFDGKTVWEVMDKKSRDVRKPLVDGVSPASAALLGDMLAVDRDRRIGSYESLIDRLDAVLAGKPPPSAPARRRKWLVPSLIAAAALVLLLGLGVWLVPLLFAKPAARGYEPTGSMTYLFDGTGLNPWRSVGGGDWSIGKHPDEGGVQLNGVGTVERALPQQGAMRLEMGIDLGKAEAVEVRVAEDPATGAVYVVRVERTGVTLGKKNTATAPLEPLGPVVPYLTADELGGRVQFVLVLIDLTPDGARVQFEKTTVGVVSGRGLVLPKVSVTAINGQAWIDSPVFWTLSPR